MKNLYRVYDRKGLFLTFQVASSPSDAVYYAGLYGFRSAYSAAFVRSN